MTSDEIGVAAASGALAVIPVGSVEAHGPHLPAGTDSLIAEEVACRLAAALGKEGHSCVITPTISFSVADCARGFPGTISIRGETLEALLLDIGRGLAEAGFRRVAILCFHLEPANADHVNRAAESIRRETGLDAAEVFVSHSAGWLPKLRGILQTRLRRDLHGGEMETSIMLAVQPGLVRDTWQSLPPADVDLIATAAAGIRFKDVGPGYFGAPALSSAEKGERIMALLVASTLQSVKDLILKRGQQ
ncbi:MAG: creatininase family protein [Dehalococcoidia bacterium]|nr:creatininase family protein [Dehalococcoidia bacterium]